MGESVILDQGPLHICEGDKGCGTQSPTQDAICGGKEGFTGSIRLPAESMAAFAQSTLTTSPFLTSHRNSVHEL
jgi:hypothetical protein